MSVYIGMDVHKKYTIAVAMDKKGNRIGREEKIVHGQSISRASWRKYFNGFQERPHVAMEATGVSYAVFQAIESHCESVVMSNPLKTKLIAEQKVKTDKIDARTIGQLRRIDFLPTVHIPSRTIRDQRELLRHRMSLIKIQTGIKNRIHALLTRCGEFYEGTDLYGKGGREYLDRLPLREPYREEVERFLRLLDKIGTEIKELTREIHQKVEVTREAMRLTTIPGVGKYLAAMIYWEIGDIERFASPSKVVGYAGLGPRVHSTGGKTFYGPITKQGNKFLRWSLVQAAQKYGKHKGPLGDWFRRIEKKRGSKTARVATARKIAVVVWHMLRDRKDFDESKIGCHRANQDLGGAARR